MRILHSCATDLATTAYRQLIMNFKSKIIIQPSFHENLEIALSDKTISVKNIPELLPILNLETKDKLSVQEYKQLKEYKLHNDHANKRKWSESCDLTSEDLNSIFPLLKDLAENKEVDDRTIADGIIVNCEVRNEAGSRFFMFHSPDSTMRSYTLSNQLIELIFKKFESKKVIEAIEQVESYFGFHSPWKITNTDPFTCRIYGYLSVHNQKGLNEFITSINGQKKILMDLSNFEGMGTILYDSFRKLNSNIPNIVWIIKEENDWVIKQLFEIGITEKEMSIQISQES